MRFRPEQHLSRQRDIRAVREKGRRIDCRAFTVWWKPRDQAPAGIVSTSGVFVSTSRVCVIASTAAVGAAVQRNRAKRRLRELFRLQQPLVPPACDLLLIARAGARTWDFPELQKRFSEACRLIAQTQVVPEVKS